MKRILLLCFIACAAFQLKAQNVQLHYDFGRTLYQELEDADRPPVTATVEFFKPDKWGNTYFIVDFA